VAGSKAALGRERKTTPEVGRDMEERKEESRSEKRIRERVASGNEASARDVIRGKTGKSHYSIA
jgi:hypothetical protein